ncbi:MAG: DUF3343 domain-containing protein [Candidatus Omnitrophota bacterium]
MIILVFESTYFLMRAQKSLMQRNIRHEVIPTPRDISSDCGMAIRVDADVKESAIETLRKANVKVMMK